MYIEFKQIIKSMDARGWSLQKDKETFYLSKFDNGINDDEYKVFIEKTEDGIIIKKAEKIRINNRSGSMKTIPVNLDHKIVLKAKEIIDQHPLNKKLTSNT